MEPNSLADSMRDIEEGPPQTYTPAPPGANDLYTQHLLAQVDQLRDANQSLLEDNRSLRQALQAKDQLIVSKDQMIGNLLQQVSTRPPPAFTVTPLVQPTPTATGSDGHSKPASKLKTKDPDVWSGTKSTLPKFLASCRVKFLLEEHNFPDEFSKIGYAGSYLGGPAGDWWHSLFQRYEEALVANTDPPTELESFTVFSKTLTTSYGDPDLTGTMERELRALRQTSSVANYAAEFQRIAGFLTPHWSDRPLMTTYKQSLKDVIKDHLIHEKPTPETLLELIAATIRIDNREYEKILDRRASAPQSNRSTSQYSQGRPRQTVHQQITAAPTVFRPVTTATMPIQPTPQSTVPTPRPAPVGPPNTSSDGTTPMELDYVARKHLTAEEKERRRVNNLCNYCGEPGHVVRSCPNIPPRRGVNLIAGPTPQVNFITELLDPSDIASTNDYAQE
jgi:Ty3 transposon capsid-like protein/Zinc knuckle